MVKIDNLMINEYGIELIQMMENAGRNLAELSRKILDEKFLVSKILVLCGGGNNGGGGMAAARHLYNWGADVTVVLASSAESMKEAPKHQLCSLRKMGVNIITDFPDGSYGLLIDALMGYGLRSSPRERVAEWIRWCNQQDAMRIALDIPSGLDADLGTAPGDCVLADATLTLALPKIGMYKKSAKRFVGDLYIADISIPRNLLRRYFDDIPDLFSRYTIISGD
jgi:NAD(P)H-hydrate epimerase